MESIKSIFNNMSDLSKVLIKMLVGIIIGLVVIVLIALLLRLVVGAKKDYESVESTLRSAAINYYKKNEDELPQDSEEAVVSVSQLVQGEYMKELSKYLSDDVTCSANVTVINNDDNYAYIPYLDCGDDYKTTYLVDEILINNAIVDSSDGLYLVDDEYVFRGEDVNNYIQLGDMTYRLVKINSDGSLRLLLFTPLKSYKKNSWDNRYNIEEKSTTGINDYSVSRIKDYLETIYEDDSIFTSNIKSLMVKQTLCVGSRDKTSEDLTDAAECSQTIENEMLGLLQANEYVIPSLDTNCTSISSRSCLNYNYMTYISSNFWTITTVPDSTSNVYRVSSGIYETKASSSASVLFTIHLSSKVQISSGSGTADDPYVINTYAK